MLHVVSLPKLNQNQRPNFKLFSNSPEIKSSKTQTQSSAILVTQEIDIIRDPHASERDEVSHGYIIGKKFNEIEKS